MKTRDEREAAAVPPDAMRKLLNLSLEYAAATRGDRVDPVALYRVSRTALDLGDLFWGVYAAAAEAGRPLTTYRRVPRDAGRRLRAARQELDALFDRPRRDTRAACRLVRDVICLCETLQPVSAGGEAGG